MEQNINMNSLNNLLDVKLLYIEQYENGPDWHSSLHYHNCTEFFFVLEGGGAFNIDNKIINVDTHSMIIINPKVVHTELAINNKHFKYLVLGIDGLQLDEEDENGYLITNYGNYAQNIIPYLNLMLKEANSDKMYCNQMITASLEIVIINILREVNKHFNISPIDKNISKECLFIEQYIDRHFKENITLDDLSELTYLNKYYLVHSFTKYKGISPINYLLTKRMNEAKKLLETTNLSIEAIADITGFSSQSYFTQSFKRYEHLTPSQYRKHYQH